MESLDSRAAQGIKSLLIRQVFLQIFSVIGSITLARLLAPSQFGLFATVNVTVVLISFVGDFGLAPSLIQRRDELTDHDLQVGFTLQQILITCIVVLLFIGAPWIAHLYQKTYPDLTWLIRALAFSLYLTTWRAMSALQLERQLRYRRLAWIEVVEQVSYQVMAIGLAFSGFGVWSLIWAVLVQGVLGTVLVYLAAPWKIRIAFDRRITREVLSYGIPFQIQLIINSGGIILPALVVAFRIGPQAVGYISWAQNYGNKPLVLVENVMRVGFSHFSRIQDDKEKVERTLTRYLTFLLLPSGIWLAVTATAGPAFVQWIFTDKWTPAVPALIIYAVSLNFSVLSSVGAVTLNSLGLVNFATRVMTIRTIVNVAFSLFLVIHFGYVGVPIAWLAAAVVEGLFMFTGLGFEALRRILGRVAWTVLPLLSSTLVGSIAAHIALPLKARACLTLLITVGIYGATTWAICPSWLQDQIRLKFSSSRRRVRAIVPRAFRGIFV